MFSGLGGVRGTNFAKPRTMLGSGMNQNGQISNYNVNNTKQNASGQWSYVPNTPSAQGINQGAINRKAQGGFDQMYGLDFLSGSKGGDGPYDSANGSSNQGQSPGVTSQGAGGYSPWQPQNQGFGTGYSPYPSNPSGGQQNYPTNDLFKDAEPVSSAEGGVSPQRGYAAVDENGQGIGGGFDWNSLNGSAPPPSMGPINNSPSVQYQGGPVQTGVNYDFTQNPYNHSASGGLPQRNMSPVPGGNGPYMTDDEIRANDGRDVPAGVAGVGNSGGQQSSGFVSNQLQDWLTNNPGHDISRYWEQQGDVNPGSRPQYGPQVRTYR